MNVTQRSILSLSLLLSTSSVGASAWAAPTKAACVEAHGDGQTRRKAGKLRSAREKFLVCGDESCPAVVRKECLAWAQEVDAEATSFVVEAAIGGKDTTDVKVSVDGEVVATSLDGRAIVTDPGPHALRFETPGAPAEEQSLTLRAGEKNRKIAVAFRRPAATEPAAAPSPSPGSPPKEPPASQPAQGRSVLPFVFAGVGVVGLAGFTFFGLDAGKKKSELDDRGCKPACPKSDVDAVKRDYLFANVSLGVGAIGLGVATYLFMQKPKTESAAFIAPTSGGGVAGVAGRF